MMGTVRMWLSGGWGLRTKRAQTFQIVIRVLSSLEGGALGVLFVPCCDDP